ncbi:hypothetical protein MKEN_00714000 [Mycena kentingensis (nom. inval.)]|nr:hypothetical protein MKEN_00714000 [Mycena kentingensis (nom. inval.)]
MDNPQTIVVRHPELSLEDGDIPERGTPEAEYDGVPCIHMPYHNAEDMAGFLRCMIYPFEMLTVFDPQNYLFARTMLGPVTLAQKFGVRIITEACQQQFVRLWPVETVEAWNKVDTEEVKTFDGAFSGYPRDPARQNARIARLPEPVASFRLAIACISPPPETEDPDAAEKAAKLNAKLRAIAALALYHLMRQPRDQENGEIEGPSTYEVRSSGVWYHLQDQINDVNEYLPEIHKGRQRIGRWVQAQLPYVAARSPPGNPMFRCRSTDIALCTKLWWVIWGKIISGTGVYGDFLMISSYHRDALGREAEGPGGEFVR